MTRRIRNTLALLLGLALGCSLAGCQAIHGLGKDIQGWTEPNVPDEPNPATER